MKIFDNKNYIQKINILLISIIISTTPLIVYMREIYLAQSIREFTGQIFNADFYSFYKMIWLLFLSFLLIILFIIFTFKYKAITTKYYIPIFIYLIFILVSTIMTEIPDIVRTGYVDRYENYFTLISYIVLLIVAINVFYKKKHIKFIFYFLFSSVTILGIHGILQYYGYDLFQTTIGKIIILPSEFYSYTDLLNFRFFENRISSTMYNPNYVGSYGSMIAALTLGLYFNFRNKFNLYIVGFLSVLMFAFLNGSKSRAGFVGFLAGLIFLIILNRKVIIRNWKRTAIIFLAFTIVFVAMDSRSIDEIFGDIVSPMSEEELVEEELILPPITNVESEMNHLTLETREVGFNIYFENDSIQLLNDNNQQLYYNYNEEDKLSFVEERYSDHKFIKNIEENQLVWEYDNKEAVFEYKDGQVFMQGMNNNLYKLEEVPAWGFEGYERLGSSRGYIWSRSIPLLRNTLLIGHGPDTYAMYFPQEDVIGKLKFLRSPGIIVDKPHNMYLQIAINTGVLSLLALLALWGGYIIEGMRLYWNADYDKWENKFGVSILAAVVAYLVTGVFNDSVVSVAPVFWILLGIGISMNLKLKNR